MRTRWTYWTGSKAANSSGIFGPERFLAAYADGLERFGYRDSPLEAMAYDAQAAFARSAQIFNAEQLVAEKLIEKKLIR